MLQSNEYEFRRLEQLVDNEDFDTAIPLLEAHWAKSGNDYGAFLLLEQCYSGKKDWEAYERLMLQIKDAHEASSRWSRYQMKFFLGKGQLDKALAILNTCLDAYKQGRPDDDNGNYQDDYVNLDENIIEIGVLFKKYGFEDAFIAWLKHLEYSDQVSWPVWLARYYAYVHQNKEQSLQVLELALQNYPSDEILGYEAEHYRDQLIADKRKQAQQHLAACDTKNAIAKYQDILQANPTSVVAQEHYLSAVTCRLFPPFLWFFSRYNFLKNIPLLFKATVYGAFFFLCSFYYKNHEERAGNDLLKDLTWIFAIFVFIRLIVFPVVLQIVAFFKYPQYHLLKRPLRFLEGTIIILAWIHVLWAYDYAPENLSFRLFLTIVFMANIIMLEVANGLSSKTGKIALFSYTGANMIIGLLGYLGFIPDIWLGFLIAGWMIPLLFNGLIDFWNRNRSTDIDYSVNIALEQLKNERLTKRIFQASSALLIIAFMVFFMQKLVPEAWRNIHIYLSFGVISISVTGLVLAEKNEPDLVSLCKKRPFFNVLLAIMFAGLCTCLVILCTCDNHLFKDGGICVYSFGGVFLFPMLAIFTNWRYRKNWK